MSITNENAEYQAGFESFVLHTDEKEVLTKAITAWLPTNGTMLDVGAGDGTLSRQLRPYARSYHVVERNPIFAGLLEAQGFQLVGHEFPAHLPAETAYDTVLLSHSLPHTSGAVDMMLDAAFDITAPNGHLVVITNGDVANDYTLFLNEAGVDIPKATDGKRLKFIDTWFRAHGLIQTDRLVCHIETQSVDQLSDILAFMTSMNGPEARRLRAKTILRQARDKLTAYQVTDTDTYRFPLEHYMFVAGKPDLLFNNHEMR